MTRRRITSMPTGLVIMALALIALVALVALFLFGEPSDAVDMRDGLEISPVNATNAMR
jgi:hypothetical protein